MNENKSIFVSNTSLKEDKKDKRIRELTVAYCDLCDAINEMDKLYRFHYRSEYKDAVNAVNYIRDRADQIKKNFNIKF